MFKASELKKIKKFYKENGYVCVKSIVDKKLINDLFYTIVDIYNKYASYKIKVKNNIYKDINFHKKLISFRKTNKRKFGLIYDDLQVTACSNYLARDPKLLKFASMLLSEKKEKTLAVSGVMTRLDCPFDQRNKLDWHQEHRYYLQNDLGKNGLFMHIPLHDVNEKSGSLKVKSKSQKEKLIMNNPKKRKSKLESLNYNYDSKILEKYKEVSIEIKKGDLLFVNFDTLHASGFNQSKRIRFSLISRVHKMLSKDFNSYREQSMFISDKIFRDKNNNLVKK